MPFQLQSSPKLSVARASSSRSSDNDTTPDDQDQDSTVTILGFGSLLSIQSAKTTFPDLKDFRLGRVNNYRRVFGHPASIFFQRDIVNYKTLEMSSLSAEYCPGASFVCSVFEVSNENSEFMERRRSNDDAQSSQKDASPVASMAFREREEEFDIKIVPYEELTDLNSDQVESLLSSSPDDGVKKSGVLCCRSTDENYLELWGQERFDKNYGKYKIETIWNWKEDSGLRPCGPYLRHCVLASEKMEKVCHDSFLDETYLVDRKTTIRSYLKAYPNVMDTLPPPELQHRYGG